MDAPDGYKITGLTGTLRVMAPEVIQCLPYGLSADVYSFGILVWEVFSCETAWSGMDFNTQFDHVVNKGIRPRPVRYAPVAIQTLMDECWSANRHSRPTFSAIRQLLDVELAKGYGRENTERSQYLREMSNISMRESMKSSLEGDESDCLGLAVEQ